MKTAIVTGASSGIGRAVARLMLENGWSVGLIARRAGVLSELTDLHPRAVALPCDVRDEAAVTQAFATFKTAHPYLDVLFNNAGVFTSPAPIDEVSVSDWHDAVAVNLTGMFLCARAAFGQMRHQDPQGGRIINNGSISAHTPRPGSVAYTTTKHGVTGLTKTLALDGREFQIAAGQIDIGNTKTDMISTIIDRQVAAGEAPDPAFESRYAADAVMHMADLPLSANVLFQTIMAPGMDFVGRG